jgi:hypothetical protein
VTAPASPERAMYDTAKELWGTNIIGSPSVYWEYLSQDERDGWARIRQAAVDGSPELAEARAKIAAAEQFCRALLAQQPPGAGHSGPVKTTARAVLSYLGCVPAASPATSAGVIAAACEGESG